MNAFYGNGKFCVQDEAFRFQVYWRVLCRIVLMGRVVVFCDIAFVAFGCWSFAFSWFNVQAFGSTSQVGGGLGVPSAGRKAYVSVVYKPGKHKEHKESI